MQTLHDMLKSEPEKHRPSNQKDELRSQYSKIGISAVAAATQFNRTETEKAKGDQSADRSSARGWSRHG